jgi:trigger factor
MPFFVGRQLGVRSCCSASVNNTFEVSEAMSFKVTLEEQETRHLLMTIEPDQETVEQEMRKAARRVAQFVRIPGFRQGKVPYGILLKHVGAEALVEEFATDLGNKLFPKALEQESIEPYGMATLQEVSLDPLRYTMLIPMPPVVKLGDYREQLRIDVEEAEINDDAVEQAIDDMLEKYAEYQTTGQPSEYGDLITVDVRAVVLDEEGNETDEVVLEEEDWDLTPDQSYPMEPAGFDEAVIGLTTGEEKQFDILWPEDSDSMYAGKNVRFSVTVHQIQRYMKPELTDEFVTELGDYDSVEDLRESLRETMAAESKQENEGKQIDAVLQKLVEISEVTYPPEAVEMEIDFLISQADRQMTQMGIRGIEHFLELTKQTMDDYRANVRPQAEKTLVQRLVLTEFIQAEGITATDDEIRNEMLAALKSSQPQFADDDDDEFEDAELYIGEFDDDDDDDDEFDDDEFDEEEFGDEEDLEEEDSEEEDSEEEDSEDEDSDDDEDDDEDEEDELEALVDTLIKGPNREMFADRILSRKGIDRMVAIGLGEEVPSPAPVSPEANPDEEAGPDQQN